MTNLEWLEALANNSPDELQAWFDSEHVETPNATIHGDTAALNAEIAELEAELEDALVQLEKAQCEREKYRELFSGALDYAGAIHALMDEPRYVATRDEWLLRDEGLA